MAGNSVRKGRSRTEECNCAPRAGKDAHGAYILLPEGVLHTGDNGTGSGELKGGPPRVGERVPRVVGVVVGGHWGRNWGGDVARGALLEVEVERSTLAGTVCEGGLARITAHCTHQRCQ